MQRVSQILGRMFRKWFGGGCRGWSGDVGLSWEERISYGVMYVRGEIFDHLCSEVWLPRWFISW